MLASAVRDSYNQITVDGDTSTNDTVLALANGAASQTRAGAAFRNESHDSPGR